MIHRPILAEVTLDFGVSRKRRPRCSFVNSSGEANSMVPKAGLCTQDTCARYVSGYQQVAFVLPIHGCVHT
jgi:hypothetical protein